MALEFALRPRLNLDAPAPRRRLLKVRLPRLALPIAAYWLGMAGVTHLLLQLTAEDSAASEVRAPDVEAAPFPVATPTAASEPAVERAPEPPPREPMAAMVAAAPREPMVAAAPREPMAAVVAPAPREHVVAAAPRAPTARPDRPEPAFRPEPRAPEARVPSTTAEAPAPRRNEVATKATADDEPARGAPVSLPSCESAAASANETMDLGAAAGAPDLSRDAFASILENGAYLARCAVPPRTALEICAAVRDGQVVGVSIKTEPRNAAIGACVTRAVTALRFPRNARLDVTRTRFEAVH